MNAKELMIGDWYTNSDGDICKVVKNLGNVVWGQGDDVSDSTDDPNPIPLTPEILEKNGWWYEIEDMWLHDEVNFCIEKWNGKFQCYDINQIKLDSVHQLQQILRLCGLNNLADNFKV